MIDDHPRARRIVKLAAKGTRLSQPNNWLLDDERGVWEKMALDLLRSTYDRATELKLTEEQVDKEIAGALLLSALEACLNSAKKRPAKTRKART